MQILLLRILLKMWHCGCSNSKYKKFGAHHAPQISIQPLYIYYYLHGHVGETVPSLHNERPVLMSHPATPPCFEQHPAPDFADFSSLTHLQVGEIVPSLQV